MIWENVLHDLAWMFVITSWLIIGYVQVYTRHDTLWRWIQGRQVFGYYKMPLILAKKFDFYLIRIEPGYSIPWHRDPADAGCEHHRINFWFTPFEQGFRWTIPGMGHADFWQFRCIHQFRPDIMTHCFDAVDKRTVMFSFGWSKRIKN